MIDFKYQGGEVAKIGDVVYFTEAPKNIHNKRVIVDIDINGFIKYYLQYSRDYKCVQCNNKLYRHIYSGAKAIYYILIDRSSNLDELIVTVELC